jgi:hypothetical protein
MISEALKISCLCVLMGGAAFAQAAKQELISLKTQYENALDRVVAPLQEKYLVALRGLKEKYTKAGDLESAILVDRELKHESSNVIGFPSKKLPDTEAELREFLIGNVWIAVGKEMVKYRFGDDGRIVIEGKDPRPYYQVTGRRKVTVYWGAKIGDQPNVCHVSEDCLAISEMTGNRNLFTRAD